MTTPKEPDQTTLEQELAAAHSHTRRLQDEVRQLRDALAEATFAASTLVDASPDIVMLVSAGGTVLAVNETGCKRLHAPRKELIGSDVFSLFPPDLASSRKHWLKLAVDSRKTVQCKDEHKGRVYGHRLYPVVDERTHAMRVAIITRDITESEQAYRAMRDSEARFRAIVEDQTELICRYDKEGALTFLNQAYARFYGKKPEELLGLRHEPDIPDEDRAVIDAEMAKLGPSTPMVGFEHRVILENGELRWQHWTHRAILDAAGRVAEIQAVGRPITKRKLAEKKLNEHREFLHKIIDTVPNLIFVKNRAGEFTLVNKAMADLYGSTVDRMLGKRGRDFNPHEDETSLFHAEDLEVLDSHQPIFIPQRAITNAKGESRWYATVKLPLVDTDQVLGVAVDITERKRAETERITLETQMRQSQKMQALGTLAGGIAHDFNNMIFAILGFVRLAQKQCENGSKASEYLDQIQSAGMRASQLVRQILTFSRRSEQELKPVRVIPLCKEIVKMLRATMPATVRFSENLAAERDLVFGDPIQIHQVLMNLCTNAAHAMHESGGDLALTLRDVSVDDAEARTDMNLSPGDYLELVVSDTGHGIPDEIMDQIFDPFFTTKKPGEGTGMGLSVVHGIVMAHSGAIHVDSEPGQGTSFRILLPLLNETREAEHAPEGPVPGGDERLLFVDDEKLLTDMARDMLSGLGYRVCTHENPAEALSAFADAPDAFDLVITGQTMPHMTGLLLAREIKTLRPDAPIILLTGFSESATPENAKAAGIDTVLMKPLVEDQLARAIRRALDRAGNEEPPHA